MIDRFLDYRANGDRLGRVLRPWIYRGRAQAIIAMCRVVRPDGDLDVVELVARRAGQQVASRRRATRIAGSPHQADHPSRRGEHGHDHVRSGVEIQRELVFGLDAGSIDSRRNVRHCPRRGIAGRQHSPELRVWRCCVAASDAQNEEAGNYREANRHSAGSGGRKRP